MNAYERIKQAQRKNERDVLRYIRLCEREKRPAGFFLVCSAWCNALDRLIRRGKVRYSKMQFGYATVKTISK